MDLSEDDAAQSKADRQQVAADMVFSTGTQTSQSWCSDQKGGRSPRLGYLPCSTT